MNFKALLRQTLSINLTCEAERDTLICTPLFKTFLSNGC